MDALGRVALLLAVLGLDTIRPKAPSRLAHDQPKFVM